MANETATPPVCPEEGCYKTDKVVRCVCGNWFCDHCGFHVDDDHYPNGNICWRGAA